MKRVSVTVGLLVLLGAAPAAGQDLSDQLSQLFTFGDCGDPLCLDLDNEHGNHYLPAVTQGDFTMISFITQAVGNATARTPISATSSGATFKLVGGLPVRTSTSAGPIFAERSQTLGKGRFYVGTNVTVINFESLNGVPADNLNLNFAHEDVDPTSLGDPEFENDLISLNMSLNVDLAVASLFATWGVLDNVDVGVAVPFVRTSIRGRSTATVQPFSDVTPHFFAGDIANPVLSATSTLDGSSAGIGDVVGRVKVNVAQSDKAGVAILADVRFPTGNEDELLGSGSTTVKGIGVVSLQFGGFSPHLNAGYLARTDSLRSDAVLATIGFDNLVTPWATLAFDVISEWQLGENKITLPDPIVLEVPYPRTIPSSTIPERKENILNASLGMKFLVRGGTVLVLNGLVPLRETSLQPDFMWTAGVELTF